MRRFAAARGARLEWVGFGWRSLADDLRAGRFDVAVGGVTVRPERSARGRFTRPLAEAGAVALVRRGLPARAPEDLGAGTRIAVNAGGHLERVAREHFPAARLVAVPDNAGVPALLARGEVDAVVTDEVEAPRWLAQVPGARVLGPFTRDRKAWWVRADRPELARALDDWLAAREADGTLARLRAERLGLADAPRCAAPLPALLSALRERLELMPLVAEAKRASGAPVEDPAREEKVLADAVAAVRAAAARRSLPPPPDDAVRAVFRAQIEAGKALQAATLAGPPSGAAPLDLAGELRPALTYLGERIAALLVDLPADLSPTEIRRAADAELSLPGLPPTALSPLSTSLGGVSKQRGQTPSVK